VRGAGYKTQVAYDGLSAVDAAEAFHPEIALLDIGLPGIDGYQLASRLRNRDEFKDTLFVAVSGYGQPEDRRRSQEAGFHHHLVKPVDPQELLELIGSDPADGRRQPDAELTS
jgi:CheY-like chemotaxis protein